jgi:hypothetical protein
LKVGIKKKLLKRFSTSSKLGLSPKALKESKMKEKSSDSSSFKTSESIYKKNIHFDISKIT